METDCIAVIIPFLSLTKDILFLLRMSIEITVGPM